MDKVLIVCERYSENLGDGIIYKAVDEILSSSNVAVNSFDLTYLNGQPEVAHEIGKSNLLKRVILFIIFRMGSAGKYLGYLTWILKNKRYFEKEFRSSLCNEVDEVFIGGGQLLTDTPLGFMLRIYTISKICRELRVPYSILSCGVGKNFSIFARFLYKEVFNNAKYITVRDRASAIKIKSLCGLNSKKVEVINDPVFTLNTIGSNKMKNNKMSALGVNIQAFNEFGAVAGGGGEKGYVDFINGSIKKLVDKYKYKYVYLFTNGSKLDQRFMKENFSGSGYKMLDRPKTPDELIDIISEVDCIIASRMHCGIVSYTIGVPFYQIVWDEKINNIWKGFGLSDDLISLGYIDKVDISNVKPISNNGEVSVSNIKTIEVIKGML